MSAPNDKNTPEVCTFAYFLESVPPGAKRTVSDLFSYFATEYSLNTPEIRLPCPTKTCRGVMFFESSENHPYGLRIHPLKVFLTYTCRNCRQSSKTYALQVWSVKHPSGSAVKYGEMPTFGSPLPPRLIQMFGADRELLLQGWRSENQNFGIGAFVYYRRVVENQKDRLLEEIRKSAERLGADEKLLENIDRAMQETQFTKSLNLVKGAIPDGLKVQGDNPLKLLHRALSKAVHRLDDDECLELATSVRVVLTELVSNIEHILKDEREVEDAVKKLRSIK